MTINHPLWAIAIILVLGVVYIASWARICKRAEVAPIWLVLSLVAAMGSISFQPLVVVPPLIMALAPWPATERRYRR